MAEPGIGLTISFDDSKKSLTVFFFFKINFKNYRLKKFNQIHKENTQELNRIFYFLAH